MQNMKVAADNWYRYAWVRDQGHTKYCEKHDLCERFFAGDQWDARDRAALTAARRPALTINKIIAVASAIMGEQIYNRVETSFQPRRAAKATTADILTKLFKQITDDQQLAWKRSDMYADGIIGSRGFLDIRMCFDESMRGDIEVCKLNPKNVLIDPDADDYDPDTWNEVIISKWLTVNDIAVLYNEASAKRLRGKGQSIFPFGYDSLDTFRDRVGGQGSYADHMYGFEGFNEVQRNIRVIERQYKKLDKQLHFVYPKTGEARPIPSEWEESRVKYVAQEYGLQIIKKMVKRIRWTVTAEDEVLHDDWSPYKRFTVIPFFPYFRHGNTIGVVEQLLGPQELLNKSESQNLHIINTSANSGWKYRDGSLVNMSHEDLEERGAETGLAIAVNGDPEKDLVKITPNSVPTGHDRLAYKADEHLKSIAGVPDQARGFAREDVANKAIKSNQQAAQINNVKPMDSLARTDFFIARHILDLIQEFYSEERIEYVTKDQNTGEAEEIRFNYFDQATSEIVNDLTIGEFGIVVTSVPERELLEDSELTELVALRKDLGIKIPDSAIIMATRLRNKAELIRNMEGDKNSEEAKRQAALQARAQEAEVETAEGEAAVKHADAGLRQAKAVQLIHEVKNPDGGTPGLDVDVAGREQSREDVKTDAEISRKDRESNMKIEGMAKDQQLKREKTEAELRLQAEAQAQAQAQQRVDRMTAEPKEEA